MKLLYYSLAFALPILAATSSPGSEDEKPKTPCAIRSPLTNSFFDLNKVRVELPEEGKKSPSDARNTSWPARGWDYGTNFTLNICGPVVEKLDNVFGVPENKWQNISAYYQKDGKTYSLGQQNDGLVFRGRKLILNYTDGSPCPTTPLSSLPPRRIIDHDDDDTPSHLPSASPLPTKGKDNEETSPTRRKTTIISLLCASDPLAPPMAISFVASPDSCTYIFEARTPAACGGVEIAQQSVGPAGVFGVIALIAVLVYLVGGCFYQRTVMHQRGWRQLPNYGLWAGIAGFFRDIIIIATASCSRFLPGRKGYIRVDQDANNHRGRRGRQNSEDENRLMDQLDEEWNN